MLETLSPQPADPLLKLISEFNNDNRVDKIDLGVGVYRDNEGATPVMRAVKHAEQRLVEAQLSKSYLGLAGDPVFLNRLFDLIISDKEMERSRLAAIQTPGSSAALRLSADLCKLSNSDAKIWIGLPTWSNHIPIFTAAGLHIETYTYLDLKTRSIDMASIYRVIETASKGDILLLQGCCHNPTGVDLPLDAWRSIGKSCATNGITPLIDIAYQGLGVGLDQDIEGVRSLLAEVPEALLTVSCSKNFGLYRDRAGALFVIAETSLSADVARSNVFSIARTSYSMPPDHGAAVVKTILEDDSLYETWTEELAEMRSRILSTRELLAYMLREHVSDFSYLGNDRGMFSMLPLSSPQISELREKHGVYMSGDGRINIAGLRPNDVERFVHVLKQMAIA